MRQGCLVRVFKFTTQRYAVCNHGYLDTLLLSHALQVIRRCLPLDGRVGGNDQLFGRMLLKPPVEFIKTKFGRPDSVQRAQAAKQHEIQASKCGSLLKGENIHGRFDHAQYVPVPPGVTANVTKIVLGQITTLFAAAYPFHRLSHNGRQLNTAFPVSFQQVKGHALRRFRAYSGQAPKRINQLLK